MPEIPILLLAAGSSSRMKQPKQLLPWGSTTLVEHQISTLLETGNPVFLVLGAHSEHIIPVVEKFEVNIVINENWKNGMGSSIAAGMHDLLKLFPASDGVLVGLVDQPLIPVAHYKRMFSAFCSDKQQIICSLSDSGWEGVPAIFDKFYFKEIQALNGESGAKKIIQKYKQNVHPIECGEILEDMDTYEKYCEMYNQFGEK